MPEPNKSGLAITHENQLVFSCRRRKVSFKNCSEARFSNLISNCLWPIADGALVCLCCLVLLSRFLNAQI